MRYRDLPPLNAIKAFDAVARCGSFTAAARELCISQGSISRHVANLEDALGSALFAREASGASLTPAGRRLYEVSKPALEGIARVSMACRAGSRGISVLRISTLSSFGLRCLTPRLQDFQKRHPGVLIDLTTADARPDMVSTGHDAAIVSEPRPDRPASKEHLFDEVVVPICEQSFAEEHRLREPGDLSTAPLIDTTTRPELWRDWFNAHGVQQSSDATVGLGFQHYYISIQAALSGLGVAIVPEILVREEIAAGTLVVPINASHQTERTYSVVTNPTVPASPALANFCAWLKVQMAQ